MKTENRLETKEVTLTVQQLVDSRSFKDQDDDGNSLIHQPTVMKYVEDAKLVQFLNSATNPITLTHDGKILQGNHRKVAASIRLSLRTIDPSVTVKGVQYVNPLTDEEYSSLAYAANHCNARKNYRTHFFGSSMAISVKVAKPVLQAVKKSNPHLGAALTQQIAQRLAAALNQNPILVEQLREGAKTLPISLKTFIEVRHAPEANENFNSANVNVDVRSVVDELAETMRVASDVALQLSTNETLKKMGYRLNGRSTLMYLIYSLGISGQISASGRSKGKLNAKKIITALKNRSTRVKNAIDISYSDPVAASTTFLEIFKEEAGTDVSMPEVASLAVGNA